MGGQNPALAYHQYLGPAMFVPMARVTLDVAAPQRGERVLDVACGTGIVTAQLPARVGPTGTVVGLDINPAMLAVAGAEPSAIEWKHGSGVAMDLADASFDLVVCQHGLQFFPDRDAGAREMRRVLVRGGRAVIACWRELAEQAVFAALVRAQARHLRLAEAQVATPFSFGDADALRGVLVAAGFERVTVEHHVIDAEFPRPDTFVRMMASAAVAVMPDKFASAELAPLVAAIAAECADEIARHRDGEVLRVPLHANVAVAST